MKPSELITAEMAAKGQESLGDLGIQNKLSCYTVVFAQREIFFNMDANIILTPGGSKSGSHRCLESA